MVEKPRYRKAGRVGAATRITLTAVIVALRSIRGEGRPLAAENPLPSRIFGPARLIATPAEREVQKQWDELPALAARSVGTSGR